MKEVGKLNDIHVPNKYEAYLMSDQFDKIRQSVLSRDNHKCVVCVSQDNLQVHHLTYEDIYKEDLMIINDKHVKLIHDLLLSRKSNARVCLPHNIEVVKSYDRAIITKEVKEVIDYNIELNKYASLPNGRKLEIIDEIESNNNDVCRIDSRSLDRKSVV